MIILVAAVYSNFIQPCTFKSFLMQIMHQPSLLEINSLISLRFFFLGGGGGGGWGVKGAFARLLSRKTRVVSISK